MSCDEWREMCHCLRMQNSSDSFWWDFCILICFHLPRLMSDAAGNTLYSGDQGKYTQFRRSGEIRSIQEIRGNTLHSGDQGKLLHSKPRWLVLSQVASFKYCFVDHFPPHLALCSPSYSLTSWCIRLSLLEVSCNRTIQVIYPKHDITITILAQLWFILSRPSHCLP